MEPQKTWDCQSNLENKEQSWRYHLPNPQTTVIQCVTDTKLDTQSLEINGHTSGHLVYDKEGKNIQWRKDSLLDKWCWENSTAACKKMRLGLPWWFSGKESACQCRGRGFHPQSGKILHAAGQLSPCATTIESEFWSPQTATEAHMLQSPCPATREATAMSSPYAATREQPPVTTTRESPRAATKTQCKQK